MDKPIQTYKLLEGWQISYIKPCTAAATLGHSVGTKETKFKGEMTKWEIGILQSWE